MASGEMSPEAFRRFLADALGAAVQVSREGAVHFICMDWRHMDDVSAAGRNVYGELLNLCIWNKSNAGMGSLYRSKHELVYAKGQLLRAQGRCEEAIIEFEMVLAINRNSAGALTHIGRCRISAGLLDEAIQSIEQAIRLSPHDSFVGVWYSQIGLAYLLHSRTDEAILWLEKSRSTSPNRPFGHIWLAAAYGLNDDTKRAAAELAEARRLSVDLDAAYSSIARLRAGRNSMSPKVRSLYEATFDAGLRKAGIPEE